MIRGTITGVKELDAALKHLPDKIMKKILRPAIRKTTKALIPQIEAAAPVDTGLMKSKIEMIPGKRHRTIIRYYVGPRIEGKPDEKTDPFYMGFVEFGTSRIPGTGFMRKVFERNAEKSKGEIINLIRQGLNKLK